jgi:hypothetical protein
MLSFVRYNYNGSRIFFFLIMEQLSVYPDSLHRILSINVLCKIFVNYVTYHISYFHLRTLQGVSRFLLFSRYFNVNN